MSQTPPPATENPPVPPISDAARLHAYLACEAAILSGHQSYTIEGTGTFTRANLREVQAEISRLRAASLSALRPTLGGIVTTQVRF